MRARTHTTLIIHTHAYTKHRGTFHNLSHTIASIPYDEYMYTAAAAAQALFLYMKLV